jgi:hypothetical protein
MAGPSRTEPIQSIRSQPYRRQPFRPWETETEHTNAEGGPSVTKSIQLMQPRPPRHGPFRPWEAETEHTNAEGGPPVTKSIQLMQPRPPRRGPFRPWETKTEHTNAEAGPSTPPPRVLTVGPPTVQPSGGQSVTTADAENNQPIREEDEVLMLTCITLIFLVHLIECSASESD